MNEYKITYAGESEGYRIITDRTEAAAKKFFRETAKELDLGRITIESVELLNTNALASKRNERETLEIIRQLVADLGEQSYLATAFEGCFEDAESNIENDFGDSWKRRCESAERKLDEAQAEIESLRERLTESKKDWEAAHVAANLMTEQKDAEIKAIRAKMLTDDELCDIKIALEDRVSKDEEDAKQAAADIVKYADDPSGEKFLEARNTYHIAKHDAEVIRELLERVEAARTAAHTTVAANGAA